MDYKVWFSNLEHFFKGLDALSDNFEESEIEFEIFPSLTLHELNAVEAEFGLVFPGELKQMWLTGANGCDCSYRFEYSNPAIASSVERITEGGNTLFGGPGFIMAQHIHSYWVAHQEWAEQWPDEKEANYWRKTIPIQCMINGDRLGRSGQNRGPMTRPWFTCATMGTAT